MEGCMERCSTSREHLLGLRRGSFFSFPTRHSNHGLTDGLQPPHQLVDRLPRALLRLLARINLLREPVDRTRQLDHPPARCPVMLGDARQVGFRQEGIVVLRRRRKDPDYKRLEVGRVRLNLSSVRCHRPADPTDRGPATRALLPCSGRAHLRGEFPGLRLDRLDLSDAVLRRLFREVAHLPSTTGPHPPRMQTQSLESAAYLSEAAELITLCNHPLSSRVLIESRCASARKV